jgi:hypothetical protein
MSESTSAVRRPRVVFLDIDGVLNSTAWWRDREQVSWTDEQIDPRAVAILNEIAPQETTRIVVSSTWRLMGLDRVRNVLERVGVKARVVGVTPDLREDYARGKEIALWLRDNGGRIGAYVVIDDDHDAGIGHGPRFIKTDVRIGLTAEHVTQARAMFDRDEAEAEANQ